MGKQLTDAFYWISWRDSMMRIVGGFVLAQAIGITLGLLLGASKAAHNLIYPVFEIMRPVPPLAWVPVAVIFWPTPEMSMVFVTFLGAFFIVVINIVDGVHSIDARYLRAARSLGSSRSDMFWHILLPGSLPSIVVGMTVGMGVTWAVVVAAEMIASRTGLGYLTWSAYVAGEFPVIIIGMMSIGIAGYVCSAIIALRRPHDPVAAYILKRSDRGDIGMIRRDRRPLQKLWHRPPAQGSHQGLFLHAGKKQAHRPHRAVGLRQVGAHQHAGGL